jgi:transposase (fragment)
MLVRVLGIVPKDYFLRKEEKAIDFKFIYDLIEKYYNNTTERNSLDSVVLFKLVFLKDFYRIKSYGRKNLETSRCATL